MYYVHWDRGVKCTVIWRATRCWEPWPVGHGLMHHSRFLDPQQIWTSGGGGKTAAGRCMPLPIPHLGCWPALDLHCCVIFHLSCHPVPSRTAANSWICTAAQSPLPAAARSPMLAPAQCLTHAAGPGPRPTHPPLHGSRAGGAPVIWIQPGVSWTPVH